MADAPAAAASTPAISMGMGIGINTSLQAGAQVISAIGGICSSISQGKIMDINHQIQKDTIKTQGQVAKIEKDGMIEDLEKTSEFNGRMADMNERALNAKEERYKAEGELSEVDHEIKENKLTEKMAEPGNDKRLGMLFRSDSFYGSPLSDLD